jgi:hypothetical protein
MNNSGVTLVDVRNEAIDAIRKLKNKEIDVRTAKEIKGFLGIIVDCARTQNDFLNALPKHIKDQLPKENILAIAGTLRDRDAELDESLTEIENKNTPVDLSKQ